MKTIFAGVLLALLLAAAGGASAEEMTPAKQAAIKEMLTLTGALEMGEMFGNAIVKHMVSALKSSKVDLDPRAFTIIEEEVSALIHEELIVKESLLAYIYPTYHEHFSLAELNGLIQFYKTPLGKKTVAVMPAITRDSMAAGQQWGNQLVPELQARIKTRLQAAGIDIGE